MLLLLTAHTIQAKDFFFGFTSQGSNAFFTPFNVPVTILNSFIGGGTSGLTYDWVHFSSNDGREVRVRNGEYFGIRARDMFNNFGIGVQLSYQPQYSIFGMYLKGGYKFRQFRLDIDPASNDLQKYKANGWNVGIGIRLTPFLRLLEHKEWSPFIEFGTTYNDVFKVTAPYDNAKDQFGKGMSTSIGIGIRKLVDYDESVNFVLSMSIPHYNYLNREFELRDGTKPYEHIRSRNFSVSLSIQLEV